ncbi:MAG TPA: FKBP-type peptidyl-prolyl cis-trans isomerase [Solirubrobacterales bacterium]|nr:FKBP-type peptidyl-prolyl cis-trans isomerase [Solirubrobacterales bacterium]
MRGVLLTIAVCLALAVAGCGGSDDSSSGTGAETSASAPQESINKKPVVEVPSEPPPTRLKAVDLIEGTGKTAKNGDTVSVQYVLVDYQSGKEIESSWEGEPFTFELGTGGVIPGWDIGVQGMKEGGRRELIIPPELAYGAEGSPPSIKPNATLIFVVDMVKVE